MKHKQRGSPASRESLQQEVVGGSPAVLFPCSSPTLQVAIAAAPSIVGGNAAVAALVMPTPAAAALSLALALVVASMAAAAEVTAPAASVVTPPAATARPRLVLLLVTGAVYRMLRGVAVRVRGMAAHVTTTAVVAVAVVAVTVGHLGTAAAAQRQMHSTGRAAGESGVAPVVALRRCPRCRTGGRRAASGLLWLPRRRLTGQWWCCGWRWNGHPGARCHHLRRRRKRLNGVMVGG